MNYLKPFLVAAGLAVLAGCSFLYQDPAAEYDAVIDLTEAEREEGQWEMSSFEAVNQDGETVTDEDLEGTYYLAKTIFTRCPTVCMTMTPNMVSVQQAMEEEGIENVQIVSFTVDPDFDTPERLAEYGESYGAEFDNWQFLTGYDMETLEEVVMTGMRSRVVPGENDIGHPTRFFLFNDEGETIRMYNGERDFDLEAIIADLKHLDL
ncbi:electron transporter SenC [Alteribacter lacisalsi]|uniref:Electron transporter SenC n=1 Tax=Alteribacter lacisalsi TaxID=2045244 RepID=A0A2W0H6D6_9BACI|nr:SCO family protein [Alteribacter lacisalsi]PYZ97433.1 electron transporter SenC [Alteribacter lacisalsi]